MFWAKALMVSAAAMMLAAVGAILATVITGLGWADLTTWVGTFVVTMVGLSLLVLTTGIVLLVKQW